MAEKNDAAPTPASVNGTATTSAKSNDTTNANIHSPESQNAQTQGNVLTAAPSQAQPAGQKAPSVEQLIDQHGLNTFISYVVLKATNLERKERVRALEGSPNCKAYDLWHEQYVRSIKPENIAVQAIADEICTCLDERTDRSDPGVECLSRLLNYCLDYTDVKFVKELNSDNEVIIKRLKTPLGYVQLLRRDLDRVAKISEDDKVCAQMTLEAWRHRGHDDFAVLDDVVVRYVPDCNESDAGPYEKLTDADKLKIMRKWNPGMGRVKALEAFEQIRKHIPNFDEDAKALEKSNDAAARDAAEYADKYLVPVRNGMLDRKTGTLRPFTRDDRRVGKFAGVTITLDDTGHITMPPEPEFPDEAAPNGVWKPSEWFAQIAPDQMCRLAILMTIIACLFPRIDWRKAFLYYGIGRNGKGCLILLVETMVGPLAVELVTHFSLDEFTDEKNVAELPGKMLNLSDESNPDGFLADSSKLKAFITHDWVRGRAVYKQPVQFRPNMTSIFCLNQEMKSADKSEALFGRLHTIVFPQAFFGKENPRIKEVYMRDPRVASWFASLALTTFPDLVKFEENDYVRRGSEIYRDGVDPVRQFWRDISGDLEVDPHTGAPVLSVPMDLLYQSYKCWHKANVPSGSPVGQRAFCASLVSIAETDGWTAPREGGSGVNGYARLTLKKWFVRGSCDTVIDRYLTESKRTTCGYEPLELWQWKCKPSVKADGKGMVRGWLVRSDYHDGADKDDFETPVEASERYVAEHGRTPAPSAPERVDAVAKGRMAALESTPGIKDSYEAFRADATEVLTGKWRAHSVVIECATGDMRRFTSDDLERRLTIELWDLLGRPNRRCDDGKGYTFAHDPDALDAPQSADEMARYDYGSDDEGGDDPTPSDPAPAPSAPATGTSSPDPASGPSGDVQAPPAADPGGE